MSDEFDIDRINEALRRLDELTVPLTLDEILNNQPEVLHEQ